MVGHHYIEISNKRISYKFTIERNISIIRGDSATGKSELLRLINEYSNYGVDSGIELKSDVNLVVIDSSNWKEHMNDKNTILFIDEVNYVYKTTEFVRLLKKSDCYCVIISRESLDTLPYSINSIYKMIYTGTYNTLVKMYDGNKFYTGRVIEYNTIVTEDKKSSFFAMKEISSLDVDCCSGNSTVLPILVNGNLNNSIVLVDGAAFGPYIEDLLNCRLNLLVLCPESFEYLILKSGIVDIERKYYIEFYEKGNIESSKYFSYERYFTHLLTEFSGDTFNYSKGYDLKIYKSAKFKSLMTKVFNDEFSLEMK